MRASALSNSDGSRRLSAPSLISIVFAIVLVAVFAKLGLWQLARAQEKNDMLAANELAANKTPLRHLDRVFSTHHLYRRVELQGEFDFANQFLLDNRIYNGKPGYEVLTPFYPVSTQQASGSGMSSVILVNRGWLPAIADRTIKPQLPVDAKQPRDRVTVTGLLTTPSKGFTLGDAIDPGPQNWPLIIQYIDYETIARKLDRMALINAVIISSPDQPWNYTYSWQPVAHGPEKHYGYAFQWFAMLVAVLVLFVYLNFIKKDE